MVHLSGGGPRVDNVHAEKNSEPGGERNKNFLYQLNIQSWKSCYLEGPKDIME